MTTVPELVAPGDLARAVAWREVRRDARRVSPGMPVTMALVTDGADATTATVLRDAGVELVGLLAPEPLESLVWAAEAGAPHAYAEMVALLSDEVEAICVELPPPLSDIVVRQATRAGMHVLLVRPQTHDPEALREVVDTAEDADLTHVVALDGRAWPAAWHAQVNAPSLGLLRQVTVLGAPADETGRAEVADLAGRWAGEVLAVCADPAAMPAAELAPGAPVTLAMLTASGATVLINEEAAGTLPSSRITLVGTEGRVVVEGRRVRRQDASGLREWSMSEVPGSRPGLIEATYDVVRATELDDPGLVRGATLHDLLTVTRLLDAAERSREQGGWIEL